MTNPKEELIEYAYNTVCKKRPELCNPRKIQLVAWDADDTMWTIEPYGIASSIVPPFVKIDEDTVEAGEEPYYRYTAPKPEKPKPKPKEPKGVYREPVPIFRDIKQHPVTQRWFVFIGLDKSGKEIWELISEEEAKRIKKEGLYREEFEIEEWWKTPEVPSSKESEEITEIAKELIESLPEKQKKVVKTVGEVTGKQLELVPVKRPKEEKLVVKGKRITVKLLPTFRDTLAKLKEMEIRNTIISLNAPGSVQRIVEAFGLSDEFIEIRDSWENKAKVFKDITARFHINPCQAIFVDNMLSHVEDVSDKGALGLVIGKNKDIEKPIEVLNYIEAKHG